MLSERGGNLVTRLCLGATPDFRGRYNRSPRLGISISDLADGRNVNEYFITGDFISFRDVFNNLDGDARAMSSYEYAYNSGSIAALAAVNLIMSYEDDMDDAPAYVQKMGIDSRYSLSDIMDAEFPELRDRCFPYISSYLFGRIMNDDKLLEIDPNKYEDIYFICEDLLWHICSAITNEVPDIERVWDILESDESLYPVAKWDEEQFYVDIMSRTEGLPNSTADLLLNRGLINEQRYDRIHKRRK